MGKVDYFDIVNYKDTYSFQIVDKPQPVIDKDYYVSFTSDTSVLLYALKYYWGQNYKIQIDMYMTSQRTTNDRKIIRTDGSKTPIEFSTYSNGYYLDFHKPLSTSNNSCYTGDYTSRLNKTGIASSFKKDGTKMLVDLNNQQIKIYNKETGTLLHSNSKTVSTYSWFNGLYETKVAIAIGLYLHSIKVFDQNNNVVNYFVFKKRDSTGADMFYLYDEILGTSAENETSLVPIYAEFDKQ